MVQVSVIKLNGIKSDILVSFIDNLIKVAYRLAIFETLLINKARTYNPLI